MTTQPAEASNSNILLEDGWNEITTKFLEPLEACLEGEVEVHTTKRGILSNRDYNAVYCLCYNICTQRGQGNYSEQIYNRLNKFIETYLQKKVVPALQGKTGAALLREFARRGNNHIIMVHNFCQIFGYLDRYHVKYYRLPTVRESGWKSFKTIVFDTVSVNITDFLLNLLQQKCEEGQHLEKDIVQKCIQTFRLVEMNSYKMYEEKFEKTFWDSTRFYEKNAPSRAFDESVSCYLTRVEKILEAEAARVTYFISCFYPSGDVALVSSLEYQLLSQIVIFIFGREDYGCREMLVNETMDDLTQLFRLINRFPGLVEPMVKEFEAHVSDKVEEFIQLRVSHLENKSIIGEEVAAASSTALDAATSTTPAEVTESNDDPQFIRDVISIYDKYKEMVSEQFQSHESFQKVLRKSFEELLNRGAGRIKSSYLFRFCSDLMKNDSTETLSENALEEYLDKCTQLLAHLHDRDVFGELYRQRLSRRLLQSDSRSSHDMERTMVGKLKLYNGALFTTKMEVMLNDLATSVDLSTDFNSTIVRETSDRTTGCSTPEFAVRVLSTGLWPKFGNFQTTLPPVIHDCMHKFDNFYHGKFSGRRRLQWIHSVGSTEVKATFPANRRVYTMHVMTLQAIVLLAFNVNTTNCSTTNDTNAVLSFETLQQQSGLPKDILKSTLHSLVCRNFKVLKKVRPTMVGVDSEREEEKIFFTDTFTVNDAFTSSKLSIRIPMPLLNDSSSSVVAQQVEDDRRPLIEAVIVRTMKARKTLVHQELVAEVLKHLVTFRPDMELVKKCIESLIGREFIERDPDDASKYRYLA